MSRRRVLLGGAAFVVVVVAMFAVNAIAGQDEVAYPLQYEGGKADVSLETAFEDHQLEVPEGARDIRYSASKHLHGYPMFSDFFMPCKDAVSYLTRNDLREHGDFLAHVEVRAERLGWSLDDGGSYFLRESKGLIYRVEALLVEEGQAQDCHVYIESAG